MKKIFLIIVFFAIIMIPSISYAIARAHSVHVTSHSTSSKSTVSGAKTSTKTYTTPKKFTGKYNSDNIKTEKVQESSNYSNYNSSNIFRPNFWTAMWAFQCMNNNSQEVTEQDIAKELEERGYTQEEIQEILKEGERAKEATQKEEDENKQILKWIVIIGGSILIISVIGLLFVRFV